MPALTPNLQNLATVLRHREMWPTDFDWFYWDCSTCAMGLARRLGMISDYGTGTVCEEFGIPHDVVNRIFLAAEIECDEGEDVTPEHVADAIDAYLATVRDA
jgi:ribosomal protein S19E (S16A)